MKRNWRLREWVLPVAALAALVASSLIGMWSGYRTRRVEERTLNDFASLAAGIFAQRTMSMAANAAVPVLTAVGKRGERTPAVDLVHLENAFDSLRTCCAVALPARSVASGLWGDSASVQLRSSQSLGDDARAERIALVRTIAAWDSIGGVLVRFAVAGSMTDPLVFIVYPQYDRAREPVGFVAGELDLRAARDSMFGALFARGAPLLPPALAGVPGNRELAGLVISDREGRVIYESLADDPSEYAATMPIGRYGDLRVTLTLTSGAVRGLLRGSLPGQGALTQVALSILALGLALVIALTFQRAQRLSRLRSEFATSVTHELRTPLTQILLNAETLDLRRERSNEERGALVEAIVRESRRLVRLVDNVLHFSQAEQRLLRLRPQRARLDEIARRAVEGRGVLNEPGAAPITLHVSEPVWALVDPDAVQMVIANLIDNAIRHGDGTPVRVSVSTTPTGAELVVEDGGPGITPRDRRRVFEPFVRLDAAHARHPTGTGIGLAVVADVVRTMGAVIALEQATPQGVRVRVTFAPDGTGGAA